MGRNSPQVARQRACMPVWGRLHALDCHGKVRARALHSEFQSLVTQGFAIPLFSGRGLGPDQADFVITAAGRQRAREIF